MTDKSTQTRAISEEEVEFLPVSFGETIACRTLAFYYIGTVTRVSRCGGVYFMHLDDATVIVDSGDWDKALQTGKLASAAKLKQETRIAIHHCYEIAPWNHKR